MFLFLLLFYFFIIETLNFLVSANEIMDQDPDFLSNFDLNESFDFLQALKKNIESMPASQLNSLLGILFSSSSSFAGLHPGFHFFFSLDAPTFKMQTFLATHFSAPATNSLSPSFLSSLPLFLFFSFHDRNR